jgi:spermidine synthase
MSRQGGPTLGQLWPLFFLSGACALVYELTWMRRLALVFGSTTLAVSTVLAVFMGGLAAGSLWFGRMADRRPERGVRLYGVLEIAIGLGVLVVPLLLRGASAAYVAAAPALAGSPWGLRLVQLVLVGAVLLGPTFLMGGTLPLLTRALVRRLPELSARIGALYAVNTAGAASGAFAATYLLLPALGLGRSEAVAAAVNLAVGATALALARRGKGEPMPDTAAAPAAPVVAAAAPSAAPLLAGIALSGAAAMISQVVWSRVLAIVLGSSVYAFGMMLVVFLGGLALGGLAFRRLHADPSRAALAFVVAEAGLTAWGAAALLIVPRLPAVFLSLFPVAQRSFVALEATHALVTALLVAPFAVLSGVAYPAAITAATPSLAAVGRRVGVVTAWNTAGTVIGAFLSGFVLVVWLGIAGTMVAAATASAAAAIVGLRAVPVRGRGALAIAAAGAWLLALVLPAWPKALLASSAGFLARSYEDAGQFRRDAERMNLLFYRDGVSTTLSVDEADGYRYYRSNGKTDASTYPTDLAVQVLIGQLPMHLHAAPRDVFVLGLGTGISAAAVARYPVSSIDIFDIEPGGREAARFFEAENRSLLSDPRVRLTAADGRNALLASDRTYDVIVCDPSDVWVAGVGTLFTREFYELARSRLRPGGVISQWWHTHALAPEQLRLMVATFRSVFPNASYWRPNMGDVIMLGSVEPLRFDVRVLRERYRSIPGLAEDMRRIGMWDPLAFSAAFVLHGEDLDRFLAGTAGVHTDDRPVIEFLAPRNLYAETAPENDALVEAAQTERRPPFGGFDEGRDADARATYLLGFAAASLNRYARAVALMEESVRRAPGEAKFWVGLGNQYRGLGRAADAVRAYRSALAADPADAEAAAALVEALIERGDDAEAREVLDDALARNPASPELRALSDGAATAP